MRCAASCPRSCPASPDPALPAGQVHAPQHVHASAAHTSGPPGMQVLSSVCSAGAQWDSNFVVTAAALLNHSRRQAPCHAGAHLSHCLQVNARRVMEHRHEAWQQGRQCSVLACTGCVIRPWRERAQSPAHCTAAGTAKLQIVTAAPKLGCIRAAASQRTEGLGSTCTIHAGVAGQDLLHQRAAGAGHAHHKHRQLRVVACLTLHPMDESLQF